MYLDEDPDENEKKKMTNTPASKSLLLKQTIDSKYSSQALFNGQQEILIEHAGHIYRLRITRQDKLILTK